MKILLLLIFLSCFSSISVPCYSDSIYYGRCINSGVLLYAAPGKKAIIELPPTYFVQITGYSKGYYTTSYNGIKGYVKANELNVTGQVPENPYLTQATFRLFASDYNTLKESPHPLAYDIITLPLNTPIEYIGKISGSELISGRGNSWYYCKYTQNNTTYQGYVYAGLCDSLNINYNTESVEYIPNPYTSASSEYIEYLNSTSGKRLVIIPIIFLSIIFIPLLFLPLIIKSYKRKPSSIYSIEDGKI